MRATLNSHKHQSSVKLWLGFALSALVAGCGGGTGSTGLNPCLPGGQIVLIKPAPGSTSVPTSSLTVEIASSAALLSDGYNVVLIDTYGAVVEASPPILYGPVAVPTPTASPSVPLPFASPVYYTATGFNLAVGHTYTAAIAGDECAPAPIIGATFSS
jgi:hypothetical protein